MGADTVIKDKRQYDEDILRLIQMLELVEYVKIKITRDYAYMDNIFLLSVACLILGFAYIANVDHDNLPLQNMLFLFFMSFFALYLCEDHRGQILKHWESHRDNVIIVLSGRRASPETDFSKEMYWLTMNETAEKKRMRDSVEYVKRIFNHSANMKTLIGKDFYTFHKKVAEGKNEQRLLEYCNTAISLLTETD